MRSSEKMDAIGYYKRRKKVKRVYIVLTIVMVEVSVVFQKIGYEFTFIICDTCKPRVFIVTCDPDTTDSQLTALTFFNECNNLTELDVVHDLTKEARA